MTQIAQAIATMDGWWLTLRLLGRLRLLGLL